MLPELTLRYWPRFSMTSGMGRLVMRSKPRENR